MYQVGEKTQKFKIRTPLARNQSSPKYRPANNWFATQYSHVVLTDSENAALQCGDMTVLASTDECSCIGGACFAGNYLLSPPLEIVCLFVVFCLMNLTTGDLSLGKNDGGTFCECVYNNYRLFNMQNSFGPCKTATRNRTG